MEDRKGMRRRRLVAPCTITGAKGAAAWSDLPTDALCAILRRLTVVDYVRFGAVCRHWRSAVQQRRHPPVAEPPWVVLPRHRRGDYWSDVGSRGALCLQRRKPYRLELPRGIIADRFVSSSHGWFVLIHDGVGVRLFNPLTRAVVGFPPLTAIPGVEVVRDDGVPVGLVYQGEETPPPKPEVFLFDCSEACLINKAVLLFPERPSRGGFRVVLISAHMCAMAMAAEGDDSWAVLDSPKDVYRDVACHRGLLYAAGVNATVVYDLAPPGATPRARDILTVPKVVTSSMYPAAYLVEVAGELLQVFRMLECYYNDDVEEGNLRRRGPSRTSEVRVFRLVGRDGAGLWEEVEGLGEVALFLGVMGSAAFSTGEFPWLTGNAIYFCDEYRAKGRWKERTQDMGVYHLGEKAMRLYPPRRCNQFWFRGWWFTPRLL